MKSIRSCLALAVLAGSLALLPEAPAQDVLRISEFMAVNDGPLTDEDGDKSDWIEIHNAGTNAVDLVGWYLTDTTNNFKKWRFPATNMPPNTYLLVFASNKDRRVPGAPLHTNFRLDAGGEFLGLVAPDGITVVSAYSPAYPSQVGRVSFGIPMQQTSVTLLSSGAPARVLVPTDGALGYTWTATNFDDSGWLAAQTGVGFETDGLTPFVPSTIADSVAEFSGKQGSNNWFYGYWNKGTDANAVYADTEFVPFPNADGPWGETNFWNGSAWAWFDGNPPWTQLSSGGGHPSANNGGTAPADHWAVRRYLSEFNGPLKITGRLSHAGSVSRDWVYITQSGTAANSVLYVYLTAAGDGYIDDMKLVAGTVPEAGANLLPNGDFETGALTPWAIGTDNNMAGSTIVTDVQHAGGRSLHLVATVGGTTLASSINQTIAPALVNTQPYTLSYWFRPGTNPAPLIVRFSGNWINTTFTPVLCGDGVVGRILVDGVEVFQKAVFMNSADFSVKAYASLGSRIDFALDAGPANNDNCDASTFTAKIDTEDPNIVVVADSVADWSFNGVQGEKNWFYGYYNKTADPDHVYQATNFTAFPRNDGPQGASNYWTGTIWDWYNGNPPWDEIGQTGEHPNGSNSAAEHWVIRRWVSEVSGRITVDWTLAKVNTAGGNGVTGRIFRNGVQQDFATIGGADGIGVSRTVAITNVQVGDFIDIALDATGTDGAATDSSDGSAMTAVIRGAPSVSSGIATDIQAAMKDVNSSAYIRIPVIVTNPTPVNFLTLRMKYDDGFVAYLNGVGVASRNAPVPPAVPAWNSGATGSRPDNEAVQFEDFDLTPVAGLLRPGTNILAIHGLNISASDGDFLVLPELRGASVAADPSHPLYFASPTPGAPNGFGDTNLGPLIANVKHAPNEPNDDEDLYVTAEIIRTFSAISNVTLTYRVMFSNEVTVPMLDDGLHADGLAGDGVWGGIVPASAANPGQMVRYFVSATDTKATRTRFPAYLDTVNSPQYSGTMVFDPGATSALPVLHWFIQTPTAADNATGTKCSLFFLGRFYDNLTINLHGQSSTGFPKKSYDIDMNPGYGFIYQEGADPVDDLNFLSTWADKSHMRNVLAYDSYHDADTPYHWVFPIRVQQNGAFFSVANLMENGDANYVKRLGLDPNGALYKMYNVFQSASDATIASGIAEKKTRKTEGNADLLALLNGLSQTGQPLINYIFDNVNVPEVVNFLAGHVLQNDEDCCHKNYYFYRDTEGTGEWQMMPWDVDLSFGHTWTDPASGGFSYYDPKIYATNRYSQTTLDIGLNNKLPSAVNSIPWVRQMYLRRVRTITDEQLQPPATHPYLLHYENKVSRLAAQIAPDAALDFAKWVVPNSTVFPPTQSLAQAVNDLNVNYFPPRRSWIYTTLVANGSYIAPQPTNAVVRIGAIEYNPASRNQAEEYIQLVNTNNYSVDISGWRLAGAVDYKFRGGVVIPTNGVLYVSPDVVAFRARSAPPRGGQALFIQGNYKGQLSARGENVQLVDQVGRIVQSTNYPGTPSLPEQSLRITEIMYHPGARPTLAMDAEETEYLELKNTGPVSMSLIGVHFTNGIEYAFTPGSAVTSLAAGESVLIVRNLAAFTARYGAGLRVAGEYGGALDNAGENLRLDDANGEKILDFDYNNKWYPITDGYGFSLVIVNENAAWDTWGLKESWRPSGQMGGSPAAADPLPAAIAPIRVNELLSNTDPPQVDAVELYNPTTNAVNIGGWFITDDTTNAFKFRIPDGTIIASNGYRVFTEAEFNPGGAGFAFSSGGDEVYLFSGDANTNLTGYIHGFNFGAAETGVSFGRYVTSLGEEHFVAQSAVTLTNENAGPKVGPVVISEIMYHPPDLPDGGDNQDDEFIELRNLTGTDLELFDPAFPTHTWHVRGGVDFDFPPIVTLAAGGRLLLVSFDTTNVVKLAAFRSRYGVSPGVPVFGPYSGKLDNSADSVKLSRPDAPLGNQVPYILVDAVEYRDSAPWPAGADGTGASLQRIHLAQYGNDPINWTAGVPGAGTDFAGGSPPAITAQPTDQSVLAFSPVTFSVNASPPGPLRYQWRRNGVNIDGATNALLTFSPEPLSDATYSVAVFNSAGTAISSNASLTVLIPAMIMQQPQSRTVFPTTNVTFSVAAASSSPIQYQWRFNSVDISGATNPTYTVTNAQAVNDGEYRVNVTDAAGSVLSAPARLTVLLHPVITAQPTNRLAVIGGAAVTTSFSVAATSGTPLRYQWVGNGTNLVNSTNVGGATNASLFLTNVQMSFAGNYWAVVSDNYGSVTSQVAVLTVAARPVIVDQPPNLTVLQGEDATFTVTASGTPPLSFRWRRNGATYTNGIIVSGLTNSSLTLTDVSYSNDSDKITVVVTNITGNQAVSSSANGILRVLYPPVLTTEPTNQAVNPGSNATVTAVFRGNPAVSYQWWFNQTNLLQSVSSVIATNAQTVTLTVTNFLATNEGLYTIVLSNQYGVTTSTGATLALRKPPVILVQPQPQVAAVGSTAAFSVIVTGTPPLIYRWRFNDTNLPVAVASAPTLTLTNVQTAQAGGYSVTITNLMGSVTSVVATLTVHQATTITETTYDPVGGNMKFSFLTTSGATYVIEYKDNLEDPSWQTLQTIPGTGSVISFQEAVRQPPPSQRFYQVRIQ